MKRTTDDDPHSHGSHLCRPRLGTEPTGVWLEELTTPYYAFRDAGAEVTPGSIKGGAIPVDQRSVNASSDASVERYLKDDALKAEVADTPVFTTIDPAAMTRCSCPAATALFDYPGSDKLPWSNASTAKARSLRSLPRTGRAGLGEEGRWHALRRRSPCRGLHRQRGTCGRTRRAVPFLPESPQGTRRQARGRPRFCPRPARRHQDRPEPRQRYPHRELVVEALKNKVA